MQKDQADQGLSFKKRARRRLVGAIALVLLMVVILPMMLEDREKTAQQEDVEIIMPTSTAELDATADLEDQTNTEEGLVALELPDVSSDVKEVVVQPKTEALPAKAEPKKVVKVEQSKVVEAKKAPEKEAYASKGANGSNKYYVQIGVFSDPSNIKKLQVKLSDLGYKSVTEKISTESGVKTRLRTDSFIGRNEAAIALENIKDAGLAGMVVSQK